jgi:ketol-acid reductoisomerase
MPKVIKRGKMGGGGRDVNLHKKGFEGIKKIAVIGGRPQALAQAQCLRHFLMGTDIEVVVGLGKNSKFKAKAREMGFTEKSNTLGEMYKVIRESNLIILFISDSGQGKDYKKIFKAIRPGSTLGFSHGFFRVDLDTIDKDLPENINVIGVWPKGRKDSVSGLYNMENEFYCSVVIEREDINNGNATNIANAWARALYA